jgi:hypothetical protein
LKHRFALFLVAIYGLAAAAPASTWKNTIITLPEPISDGLIEDLNNDGYKDLLLIAGNFVNIFYNKKDGYSATPDERFFYKLLGDCLDIGEVDPSSPGLELIGFSEDGVKCLRRIHSRYAETPKVLIATHIDMPNISQGPVVSNFVFDINADGKDEIFTLQDGKAIFYHSDDAGRWIPEEIENLASLSAISLEDHARTNGDLLLRPSILNKSSVLIQDINGDGLMDLITSTIRRQEQGFHFHATGPNAMDIIAADPERHRFFLDVNGDGKLDLIFIEVKDSNAENANFFPFARIAVHLRKNDKYSQTPDYFFKTIIVNDQSPFVDVDGDGDLDFISVWPEITPGSKESIIQILLESTLVFHFRCYLYDSSAGYSQTPEVDLKSKIKGDFSYLSRELPFDASADMDGDGMNDLIICRNLDSVFLYLMDFRAKNKIKSVEIIKVPGGFQGYRFSDLDGNGKSELIFMKDNVLQIFMLADK